MLTKKLNHLNQYGIFTKQKISKGTKLFSYHDWIQDEQLGWEVLSVEDLDDLSPERRETFLRYGYDIEKNFIIGTFDWEYAKHISNFMNHSCDPNMWYDSDDNIEAKKDIEIGEELTIDYGNFIFNIDQDFVCQCGSMNCRKYIKKDDWQLLRPEYGDRFPTFFLKYIKE